MSPSKTVLLLCIILLPVSYVHAQLKADSTVTLREVVVTANKFPQKQIQTGKVTTILSDSVLSRNAGKSLAELLNQQVGLVVVGSQNTPGTNQSVYLRGAGAGNTLILVDGIPVYNPSGINSSIDLNLFSVDQIERVEILKGAQSTLYGSDAVAGVINIITKKTSNRAVAFNGNLAGGSFGTYRGTAGISGALPGMEYNLQYTKFLSKGFSAAHDRTENQAFDRDGMNQDVLRLNLSYQLTPRLTWKLLSQYSRYRADLDAGAFADERDYTFRTRDALAGMGLVYAYGSGKLYVNYNVNRIDRQFINDSTFVPESAYSTFSEGVYRGSTHFLEIYTTLALSRFLDLVAGADYRTGSTEQRYRSVSSLGLFQTPPLSPDSANASIWSGYASALLKDLGGFYLELGGRLNHHSTYGNNATFSFNPSYLLAEKLKVFVNVSSGFRAPSLYQLWSEYGNRSLSPETSRSYEAGAQLLLNSSQTTLRAVYFRRRINNIITFQEIGTAPYSQYTNADQQNDEGIEVDGNWQAGKLSLTANYTFVDGLLSTQTKAGRDTTFFNLFQRPKHNVNLTLGYQVTPQLLLSTHLRSVSGRKDLFFNDATFKTEPVTLAPYYTVDLYGEYRINPQFSLFLDAKNLTNQRFFDIYGYNSRRFNFIAGVAVRL